MFPSYASYVFQDLTISMAHVFTGLQIIKVQGSRALRLGAFGFKSRARYLIVSVN